MAIRVEAFCSYLTSVDSHWTDENYSANKFIKTVKGKSLNGFGHVRVRDRHYRLDERSAHKVYEWFAEWALPHVETMSPIGGLLLVPVPCKAATIGTVPETFAGLRLAESLSRVLPRSRVFDCLRWDRRLVQAHVGGPRDPEILVKHLRLTTPPLDGAAIVLIDDVCTSGSHFRAAASVLERAGASVQGAIAAGRTVDHHETEVFNVPSVRLDELEFAVPGYLNWLVYSNSTPLSEANRLFGFAALWHPQQGRGRFSGMIRSLRDLYSYHGPLFWSSIDKSNATFFSSLVKAVFDRDWIAWHAVIASKEALDPRVNTRARTLPDLFVMFHSFKARFFSAGAEPTRFNGRFGSSDGLQTNLRGDISRVRKLASFATVFERPPGSTDGIQLSDLFLGAFLAAWSERPIRSEQAQVQAHIAEQLDWSDLRADTRPKEWKLNVWNFYNPKMRHRKINSRRLPGHFKPYRRK